MKSPLFFRALIFVLLGGLLPVKLLAATDQRLFVIDFEEFPESTPIGDQYAHLGVWFSLIGNPNDLPMIATQGDPRIAFGGFGSDSPMASGVNGLTDPVVNGNHRAMQEIAIDFDPPITRLRMSVIHIVPGTAVTANAYRNGQLVDTDTHTAGDGTAEYGLATAFSLVADTIDHVELDIATDFPDQFGYAVDLLLFTRGCTADCGPVVEVAQESAPGLGDFDSNVLGHSFIFPTEDSPEDIYSYGLWSTDSWNGALINPFPDRSHLLVTESSVGTALVVIQDRTRAGNPDGGRAEMHFSLGGDSDGANFLVMDEPAPLDFYYQPSSFSFRARNAWGDSWTDGFVIGSLDDDWEMIVAFAEADGNPANPVIAGLTEWYVHSADGSQIPLALEENRRVRLRYLANGVDDAGCIGTVLKLDGNNDAISLGDRPEYQLSDLTIEAWVNVQSYCESGGGDFIFFRGDDRSGNDPYFVRVLCDGRVLFQIDGNLQSSFVISTSILPLNQWTHVAFVCSTTTMTIGMYIDGHLEVEGDLRELPIQALIGERPGIGIGNHHLPTAFGTNWWSLDAQISDVRLWSIARTESQIQAARWHRLGGAEPGLVGYWPLSEVTGFESPDLSATGNPARLGLETGGPSANAPIQVSVATPQTPRGDLNCDCGLSVSDIGPFVLALTDVDAYEASHPNCRTLNADLNADGVVTVSDIGVFVQALVR